MSNTQLLSTIKQNLHEINEILERILITPQKIDTIDVDLINKKIAGLYEYTTSLRKVIDIEKENEVRELMKETPVTAEESQKEHKTEEVKTEEISEVILEEKVEVKEVQEEVVPIVENTDEEIVVPESEIVEEIPEIPEIHVEEKLKITEEILEQSIAQNMKETDSSAPKEASLTEEKEERTAQPSLFEENLLFKEEKSIEEKDNKIFEPEKIPESEKKSIHQKFTKTELSLNERITEKKSTLADKAQKSPITDIKSAISLNMKLSFIKDLYKGDQKEYKKMIDFISKCRNYSEAKLFLQNEKDKRTYWEDKPELVDTLMDLIHRRFRI